MPRLFFYLATCSTCERIMKEVPNLKSFVSFRQCTSCEGVLAVQGLRP